MEPQPYESDKGRRLLPAIADQLAEAEPARILYHVFVDQTSALPTPVTTSQFANAINFMCAWLGARLSPSSANVVGYTGPNDLRCFILILAGVKTGTKVLLCSARNSLEGKLALIQQSKCQAWLSSSKGDAQDILGEHPMPEFVIPSVSELIRAEPAPAYPYAKSFIDGRWDLLAYLHTSGSTGKPKLIPVYLGTVACVDALHLMAPENGKRPTAVEWAYTTLLCMMPLFHTSGIAAALYAALMFNWTIVLPPPGPISMSLIERLLDSFPMNSAFIPPSILNEMAKSSSALDRLAKLDLVISAGGPVANFAGDIISRHTSLQQIMGSTEGQWYANFPTERHDWAYFQFSPEIGYKMVPEDDGLCELVFHRQAHLDLTQPIFVSFPKLNVWHTQDLYSAHPKTPGLWKFEGRKDDLLILSNGMKINPLGAEAQLSKQKVIQAACLVGSGKFQVAVLVQLANGFSKDDETTLDLVWQAIEDCNTLMSSYAQVHRQFVQIVDEPFVWTPKGTLSRKATYVKFSKEIDSLYQEQSLGMQVNPSHFDQLHASLLQLARQSIGSMSLAAEDDLFQAGFDSLSVQLFHRSIEASGQLLQLRTIYDHPSVDKLSQALWKSLQPQDINSPSAVDDIRTLLAKYTPSLGPEPKGVRVILTGSTGFLGSYLLDTLVADPQVSEIWCLNRSQDAVQKQVQSAKDKCLRNDWSTKVKFLTAQLGLPDWGLGSADYRALLKGATHVIHNAWQVNFNLSIWSFESQIEGVSNLIQFCSEARNPVHVCYISSIGVAANWSATHIGPVPEAPVQDTAAPGTGYGASKMVAENLLHQAANSDVLRLTVCRVGQMSGPVLKGSDHGVWNPKEWLPTLIRTSSEMRALPEDLGSLDNIDWVPIDLAAQIISEMVFDSDSSLETESQFFHVVNPKTIRWKSILPVIQERLQKSQNTPVDAISFNSWVRKLRNASGNMSPVSEDGVSQGISGLKLLEFYESIQVPDRVGDQQEPVSSEARWELRRSLKASSKLQSLDGVKSEWIGMWLDQWGY